MFRPLSFPRSSSTHSRPFPCRSPLTTSLIALYHLFHPCFLSFPNLPTFPSLYIVLFTSISLSPRPPTSLITLYPLIHQYILSYPRPYPHDTSLLQFQPLPRSTSLQLWLFHSPSSTANLFQVSCRLAKRWCVDGAAGRGTEARALLCVGFGGVGEARQRGG